MLIHDLLRRTARDHPDRTALLLTTGGDSRTYAELLERTHRLANAIADLAEPGDRVAILSDNSIPYVEAYYGVPAAGVALTTLNTRLHPKEWAWILENAEASVLLVQEQYLPAIREHLAGLKALRHVVVIGEPVDDLPAYEDLLAAASPEPSTRVVSADDVAWVMYTSGTTGFPKGAQLSHRNLVTSILQSVLEYEPSRETRFLNAMPLCHVAGYLTPVNLFRGGTVLMMPGWEPEAWMQVVQEHRITSGGFAPTMMAILLAHPRIDDYDLSSLEWMGYGASKIPAELLRRTLDRFGPIVYAGMGMTELAGNILTLDREAHRRAAAGEEHLLDAVGRPMQLVDLRIVDADGNDCAVGEIGEIWVRGDQVTVGYLGNPKATAASFTGDWFHTGDLARRDEEGFLSIVDRAKDMIISGGENVYSAEVENVLHELPNVAEAAVIGLPHEVWGEQVVAVLVRRPGAEVTDDEVIARVGDRLAAYKRPKQVVFLDELPRTATGKVRKHDLRTALGAEVTAR
ncbi:long-chain fatty acid--CoA ligase [Nocardioides sp. NPDC059952]|uniref:acyl-CoA synthetase n=1 Tax=Nocardioides sp. NPDC059952 TaxID=3347014 RepID=UPI0036461214